MTKLVPVDSEGMVQCFECETRFMVVFDRNPIYQSVEFCPFCGDQVETPSEYKFICECRNPDCGLEQFTEPESACPECGDVMEPVDNPESEE